MDRINQLKFMGSVLLCGALLMCCGGSSDDKKATEKVRNATYKAKLDKHIVTTQQQRSWISSTMVAVDWGVSHFSWHGVSGVLDYKDRVPAHVESPFRIASVTKIFTAAAIFRLKELQQLSLEDTLDKSLPQAYADKLTSHGVNTKSITISQLLTHTSGLPDYATQFEFLSLALTDPQHHWTRMEQVEFALQYYTPSDAIKHPFAYADTNYILLGEIIEQRTGLSLGASLHQLLKFSELKIDDTWLYGAEKPPSSALPIAHSYVGEADAMGVDSSFDLYGGGGLVSTVDDLVNFIKALFDAKIISQITLDAMLSGASDEGYAHGLQKYNYSGLVCWGHDGAWGVALRYCPKEQLAVALTYNNWENYVTEIQHFSVEQYMEEILRLRPNL